MNRLGLLLALAMTTARPAIAGGADSQARGPEELGRVAFSTTCDPAVRAGFNRAVALLHSFVYAKARAAFRAALQLAPARRGAEVGARGAARRLGRGG